MSFTKLVVTHIDNEEIGTGIVINEVIKDVIQMNDDGTQNIYQQPLLSVVWENSPNPVINYHSPEELVFKAFYDEINQDENSIDIDEVIDYIDEVTQGSEVINAEALKNSLLLQFGEVDEDEELEEI